MRKRKSVGKPRTRSSRRRTSDATTTSSSARTASLPQRNTRLALLNAISDFPKKGSESGLMRGPDKAPFSRSLNAGCSTAGMSDNLGLRQVVLGQVLEPPELPALNKRWTMRRKAVLVSAVRSGRISIEEACQVYKLSVDEFLAWERNLERYGIPGLRSTRYQIYRDDERRAERVLSGLGSSSTLPTMPNDRDVKSAIPTPSKVF